MRCLLCLRLSWQPICQKCLNTLLVPNPTKRVLEDGLSVYSFYGYSEISKLLHTKHTYIGAKVFSQLSKHAILPFLKPLENQEIYALPIDDHVRSGYSHSAIMVKSISRYVRPRYRALRAQNRIRYSGQKLSLRRSQRRDFSLTCRGISDIILVDDIVTTGNTLMEANRVCQKMGLDVRFAITLADARG